MSGFLRTGRANTARKIDPPPGTVTRFVSEREVIDVMAAHADPFKIDDPCPYSPDRSHFGIGCGEVACFYCAKIFTR